MTNLLTRRCSHVAPWWQLAAPWHVPVALYRHRYLIYLFAGRRICSRYHGSVFGWGWSLLLPALSLATYAFVFGVVLGQARTGDASNATGVHYALNLLTGLVVFGAFSEVLQLAPTLVGDSRNL